MSTSGYRVVRPDWALVASGQMASDVLVVEHVRLDRPHPCLVLSTTLDLWVADLHNVIDKHEKECQ